MSNLFRKIVKQKMVRECMRVNFKTVKWSGNIGNGSLEILADTTFLRTDLDDRAKKFSLSNTQNAIRIY